MKKAVKILSVGLACAIVASAFGGCQSSTGTASKANETKQESTPQLVWWMIGSEPKDLSKVNAKVNDYIKGKVGATVQFKYANWGDYSKKLTTVIQSGEKYDIAFGTGISNYIDMARKNYFADLSKPLKNSATKLYQYVPSQLWKAMTLNDKIFGVPAFKDSSTSMYWVWDKNIVSKLNIDYKNIKSVQDLEPALAALKKNDSSKYPLDFSSDGLGQNGLLHNYDLILNEPNLCVRYDDTSAKVVDGFSQPDVMKDLVTLHDYMKKGYINPDAATKNETSKYQALYCAQGYTGADADWTTAKGYNEVSNQFSGPYYSTSSIQGSFLVVSASSPNIDKSVKLIELVNTDKTLRNLLAFGIEGENYKKTGDNTIKILNDGYQTATYSQGTFFDMYVVDPAPSNKWDLVRKQNDGAKSSPILGFNFDSTKVSPQVAACTTVFEKYYHNIMTGSVDPTVEVPKMEKELNNAGYQDILKEAQTQVNAFLKKS